MIVKLFKSNHRILLSVLGIFGLIVWVYSFIFPEEPILPQKTAFFYSFLYNVVFNLPAFVKVLLSFSLLFIQAAIFNNLVINHSLIEKNTYLPAVVYFVLMSLMPEFCTISPMQIVNLIILICLNIVFKIYLNDEPIEAVFNLSFIISLLTFFYLPSVFLIGFLWLCLIIYSLLKWRLWVVSFIGFIIPYFILAFYKFWTNDLGFFYNYSFDINLMLLFFDYKNLHIISLTLVLLFVFFTAIKYLIYTRDRVVMLRKFASVIFALYILSFISILLIPQFKLFHLMLSFIPSAVFICHYFLRVKKSWKAELVFYILVFVLIFNRINIF